MKELDWFVKTLESDFSVQVDCQQISFEGNILYLVEIDEALVPKEMKRDLLEQLLFQTMLFEDAEGTEWIGAIASHPESHKWLLQILLKNGESVLRKLVENEG